MATSGEFLAAGDTDAYAALRRIERMDRAGQY
jgi:hypothetical protein